MNLREFCIKDKALFERYLGLYKHELSVYSFANIYIWKRLFQINWAVIDGCLCVFFRDKIGAFLYLGPLGKNISRTTLDKAFQIMDGFNKNKEISRIENVEARDIPFYQGLGYVCKEKSSDYLCLRSELAGLLGNKFKSKRACFNYFTKYYTHEYLPFSIKHKGACLKLYDSWMKERRAQNQDPIYRGMLEDSLQSLKAALDNYKNLGFIGSVVRIKKEIKAFTFGFKLNKEAFCILYEIADLSIKGLAQFIFAEFCRELKEYKYINIMDDSGLENLKKVKLSYQPVKLIPAYIATRRDA